MPEHLITPEYSSPLIERLKLKDQYAQCVAALNEAGLLELLEEPTEIPAENKGETKAKRKQLEANHTPREYLQTLSESSYLHEEGLTIEGWIARLLTRLHTKNEVIDDYQGAGKVCYLIGNCDSSSDSVPFGGWYRGDRRAYVDWGDPDRRYDSDGARSAVRIGKT